MSVKKKVYQMLSNANKKTKLESRHKSKALKQMQLSLSTMHPKNKMFDILHKKLSDQASEYKNVVNLEDLKSKITEPDCQRLTLSMNNIKQKGIEAIYSKKDKKLSFLLNGVFTSTYKFISPTLAKRI